MVPDARGFTEIRFKIQAKISMLLLWKYDIGYVQINNLFALSILTFLCRFQQIIMCDQGHKFIPIRNFVVKFISFVQAKYDLAFSMHLYPS